MKYSIRKTLLVAIPVALLGLCSCETKKSDADANHDNDDSKEVAEDRNDDKFDDKDNEKNAQFVVDAVAANIAEIRLAKQAETRAVSKDVKELAAMLVTQHTSLMNDLKKYAASKVISIPTEDADNANDKDSNVNDDNAKDNNSNDKDNYDLNWCEEMKDMHEKSIKRFEDASTDLSDAELKNIASQALPTLRTHYDKIVACHDKMKK